MTHDLSVMMGEFHLRFGFPRIPLCEIPADPVIDRRLSTIAIELAERAESILPEAIAALRAGDPRLHRAHLLLEEVGEYLAAISERDNVRAADAIGDMGYVVVGSAWTHEHPFEEIFAEIHRSNMTKQRSIGNDRMRDKGTAYIPPNIAAVLERYNRVVGEPINPNRYT